MALPGSASVVMGGFASHMTVKCFGKPPEKLKRCYSLTYKLYSTDSMKKKISLDCSAICRSLLKRALTRWPQMSLQALGCWLLLPRQPGCPQWGSPLLLETSPGTNLGLASTSSASARLTCLGPLGWRCEGFALPADNPLF